MIPSAPEFARLRLSDRPEEQHRATHDFADEAIWHDVIAQYPELKCWVVRNKTIAHEILRRLAQDEDPSIRREVASKRKLEKTLFEQLSRDPDESVRRAIAINAKCPADILERLILEGLGHEPFTTSHSPQPIHQDPRA